MTICVGWISCGSVFLIADSAVTKSGAVEVPRSQFGELHESQADRNVEESALKIFRWNDTAAVFAGDAETAKSIFSTYVAIGNSCDPLDAFTKAWESNGPFGSHAVASLFGFYGDNGANLVKFEDNAIPTKAEVGVIGHRILQFEELAFDDSLKAFLGGFPQNVESPMEVLACGLGWMQSNSIFSNLMPHGIVGHYAGLLINSAGLRWADPTVHCIAIEGNLESHSGGIPNAIIVYPLDDKIFLLNGVESSWTIIANSFGCNYGLSSSQQIERCNLLCKSIQIDEIPLQFVVFYDVLRCNITVLRVNGQKPAPGAHVVFDLVGEKKQLKWHLSKEVSELIYGDRQAKSIAFHDCHVL